MVMSVQALPGLAEANARSMAACWALGLLCHGHPAELVHEIAVHRRELAVDIVRALLAGGASIGLGAPDPVPYGPCSRPQRQRGLG